MHSHIWSLMLLRGIIAVGIGLLLVVWPDKSAEVLVMFVGAFALFTGALISLQGYAARYPGRSASIVGGMLTLVFGLVALAWPGAIATVVVYVIAAWALLFGILEIIGGMMIGLSSPPGALATGIGIVTVVLAIILFIAPYAGIFAAAWLVGFYLLATGSLTVYQAIKARGRAGRPDVRWLA